jgi:HEAT repeat protein
VSLLEDQFAPIHDDADGEFHPVSVPDTFEDAGVSSALLSRLHSSKPTERAAALSELSKLGGEDAFRSINAAFDDQAAEVRSAAAHALFSFQEDRAAAFTRALREASPDRRRKIGSAIASSGLANEAIRNLTGESRDKTYDAFSLLFLMSKAGEVQPLMRAIEEHPNLEVRLAVVKLLALSGQPDILPAFRRMAVRGSLPPEVRSAVMEAIYQITSQSPAEAQPAL